MRENICKLLTRPRHQGKQRYTSCVPLKLLRKMYCAHVSQTHTHTHFTAYINPTAVHFWTRKKKLTGLSGERDT